MKKVSLFDIRTIIGALLGIYGVILLFTSFTTSEAEKARADGINANLWVGLSLMVMGSFMIAWAIKRPVEVDEEQLEADKRAVDEAAGRSHETGERVG
jgi:hypothetical protein